MTYGHGRYGEAGRSASDLQQFHSLLSAQFVLFLAVKQKALIYREGRFRVSRLFSFGNGGCWHSLKSEHAPPLSPTKRGLQLLLRLKPVEVNDWRKFHELPILIPSLPPSFSKCSYWLLTSVVFIGLNPPHLSE